MCTWVRFLSFSLFCFLFLCFFPSATAFPWKRNKFPRFEFPTLTVLLVYILDSWMLYEPLMLHFIFGRRPGCYWTWKEKNLFHNSVKVALSILENCNIQSDLKKYTFEENIQYQAAESLSKRISLKAKAEYMNPRFEMCERELLQLKLWSHREATLTLAPRRTYVCLPNKFDFDRDLNIKHLANTNQLRTLVNFGCRWKIRLF